MIYKFYPFWTITFTGFVFISTTSVELKLESNGQLKINCDSSSTAQNISDTKVLDNGDYNDSISCFKNVTNVLFSNCSMAYLPQRFFRKVQYPEVIKIKSPGAGSIKRGDFGNNNKLKKLLMKENRLRELSSYLFVYTPNIEEVDFSNNEISRIDPDTFVDGVDKLKRIDLANNHIQSLDANLFANVVHLEYLDMDKNELVQLNCNIFPSESVVNHTMLSFEWNELEKINLDCDANVSNTKSLYISNNQINKLALPNSSFVHSLTLLSATGNKIEEIIIESDLINLVSLNLANNSLTSVADIFERCSSLESLNLSHNDLRQLPVHAFEKMKNLEYLAFENINLTKIVHGTFSDLRNLSFLDLSQNKLKKINFELFSPSFVRLEGLFINNNHLKEMTGWSDSVFPNLDKLNIADNRFNCSYLKNFLQSFDFSRIQLFPSPMQKANHVKGMNCEDASSNLLEQTAF